MCHKECTLDTIAFTGSIDGIDCVHKDTLVIPFEPHVIQIECDELQIWTLQKVTTVRQG